MKNFYLYLIGVVIVLSLLAGLLWMQVTESEPEILNEKYTINIHNCTPIVKNTENKSLLMAEVRSILTSTNVKSEGKFLTPILKIKNQNDSIFEFGVPLYGLNYIRYITNPDMFTFQDRKADEEEFFNNEYENNIIFQKVKNQLITGNSKIDSISYLEKGKKSFVVNFALEKTNYSKREFKSFQSLRHSLDSMIVRKEINRNDEINVFYFCNEKKDPGKPIITATSKNEGDTIQKPEIIIEIPKPIDNKTELKDSDDDGVSDDQDACPQLKGDSNLNGCPKVEIRHNNNNGRFEITDIPGAVTYISIQELDYDSGKVKRTVTHTCSDFSCPSNKIEANKILKLIKEITRLNVIVTVEHNGKVLAKEIFYNLSYICFTNQDCGFQQVLSK